MTENKCPHCLAEEEKQLLKQKNAAASGNDRCQCGDKKADTAKDSCGCDSSKADTAKESCQCGDKKADTVKESCGCDSAKADTAKENCHCGDKKADTINESRQCGDKKADTINESCHCCEKKLDNAKESCHCGDKKADTAKDSCHCGDKKADIAKESCGCDSAKADTAKESCQCGDKKADTIKESCGCDSSKADIAKESCHCGDKKADIAKESCGCGDKKADIAKESCQCGDKKADTAKESCHCDKNHTHNSSDCCGIDHTHNSSDCCGIDHSDSSCCGIDHSDSDCCGMEHKQKNKWYTSSLFYIIVSFVALVISFVNPFHNAPKWVGIFDFAWIAIVLCGIPIYRGAIKNLAKKRITSALLIAIAMTASIVMGILTVFNITPSGHEHMGSYFFAAGEISFLMAIGSLIEQVTIKKSRSAISELIAMTPKIAAVKCENGYSNVDIGDIKVGDIVLVKPNEIVAIDGVVTTGEGSIDEASITGESTPCDKVIGDSVYQGTKNLSQAFEIEATSVNKETTLSKLIDYVARAEKEKAPIVRLADKWAKYIVPSACIISIIVFFVTFFGFKVGAWEAINRAITILVVVCPCALALATPIAISAGIGNASRKGVLIKSGVALEALAKVNTIAFDKTGTLTEGKLMVDKVVCAPNVNEAEFIYYLATAELQSEHPIAKAILAYAKDNHSVPTNVESMAGVGIKAVVDGKKVEIVKPTSVKEKLDTSGWYDGSSNDKRTSLALVIDGVLQGIVYIKDTIRASAKETIAALTAKGYKTVMLTGDNEYTAAAVAQEIGVSNYNANLLPEDKVAAITALKAAGNSVLMVGDGVNDAPSLAMADCSLAMGAMGSSVAIETADISLMTSDISKLPFLLALSKRTLTTIKVNISASLLISLTAIFLSAYALLNVVGGALVHNASSVLVCINSALLLIYSGKRAGKKAITDK